MEMSFATWLAQSDYYPVIRVKLAPEPGPAPTWTEVAGALSLMEQAIVSKGWTRGTLAAPWGLCMLGAFLYRNGVRNMDVKEDGTPLGIAVADMLTSVIRKHWSWMPALANQRWSSVVMYNDSFCRSREGALQTIREAQAAATENAVRAGEIQPQPQPEVKDEPEAELTVTVPDYIPGEFTGLLHVLEQALVKQPELAAAGV